MTKFCNGTLITMEVMGCQVHAIGRAIRPFFTDPVTYAKFQSSKNGSDLCVKYYTFLPIRSCHDHFRIVKTCLYSSYGMAFHMHHSWIHCIICVADLERRGYRGKGGQLPTLLGHGTTCTAVAMYHALNKIKFHFPRSSRFPVYTVT